MSAAGLRVLLRNKLKRRTLLQAGQLVGAGAIGTGLGLFQRSNAAVRSVRSVCRICTMHCGLIVKTNGKRIDRVEGDLESPTQGFICHHAWALREIVHSPDRITQPLKKDGSAFRAISWTQALREIADRLQQVKKEFGGPALAIQTGWPFVRHPLIHLLHRFCRAFGTPNLATVASICEASARMGKALTAGCDLQPDLRRAKTLIVWGANPSISAPPFAHLVEEMSRDGRALIVVDPTRTELAAKATAHLQVLPGTDAALALGMMQVIVAERLHDPDFVREHTVGFDQLAQALRDYPPERVSRITGVPKDDIVRAARLFAGNGPGAIWMGLGIEHQTSGVQTARSLTSLAAVCGYVDAPGGLTLTTRPGPDFYREPLPQLYRLATAEPVPLTPEAKPIGYEAFPLHHVYNRQAHAMLLARAILDDEPYPVRALVLLGSNALVTSPDAARMRAAARRLSLLVTIDPIMSDSARCSDYVLPASTFVEAAHGIVPGQHDSWPDWKIVFELARALGLGHFFPWSTLQEALDAPRRPYPIDAAHTLWPSPRTVPGIPRFPTPSGKIELYSETLQRFRYPPIPEYRWRDGAQMVSSEFPLFLITGPRTRAFINSQFRHIPTIAAKMPEPYVEIHPTTAASAGVVDGQRVAVISAKGRVEMRARLTDRVHPRTAVVPAGWAKANANLLTDADALDPISGFPALRGGTCRIEPS